MEVHPLAALFPMMTDDELYDLADDIRENGLLHPIVVDAGGVLIDGRNRLRACEIAGVDPKFSKLNGHDAAAYIVSANLERRNLTVGQRAMALALIYPDAERGRGKRDEARKGAETSSFSYRRVQQARSVLRYSRALAEDVLAKRKSLDVALDAMEEALAASQSVDAKMADLRAYAPHLAELVDEERLTLDEAYAALVKLRADAAAAEANKRENLLRLSEAAWRATTAWASDDFVAELGARYDDEEFAKQWLQRVRPDAARLGEIRKGAEAMAQFFALAVGEQSHV